MLLSCLLTLHSPDGSKLVVDADAIEAIKPVATKHHDHVAGQTHTVIYMDGRASGFGVAETTAEVITKIRSCQPGREL